MKQAVRVMEIKCQLDATDWFFIAKLIVCSKCFGAPLCPSSGALELYRRLLPVALGSLVYRSLVWCGAVGYVSGLRDTARLLHLVGLLFPRINDDARLNSHQAVRVILRPIRAFRKQFTFRREK